MTEEKQPECLGKLLEQLKIASDHYRHPLGLFQVGVEVNDKVGWMCMTEPITALYHYGTDVNKWRLGINFEEYEDDKVEVIEEYHYLRDIKIVGRARIY